jgi:hypothetical protein
MCTVYNILTLPQLYHFHRHSASWVFEYFAAAVGTLEMMDLANIFDTEAHCNFLVIADSPYHDLEAGGDCLFCYAE